MRALLPATLAAVLLVAVVVLLVAAAVPPASADAETIVPKTAPAILADLTRYTRTIEDVRGLAFKQPVASGTQTSAEFRAFVEKDLDAELPRGKAECLSRALARLGLLPDKFDLRKATTGMMTAQVAAYYDPARRTFFVVHPDLPEMLLEPTIVHELTHALQDQHYGLENRMKALRGLDNEDVENAFRFLVEGEATYVMALSTVRAQGNDPDKSEVLDHMIEGMSDMGRDALAEQLDELKSVLGDEDTADIATALTYPDYLFRVLYDPYFGGQAALHKIRRAGGWTAVNELWRNPPTSTEQFLHPEKLASGRRDEPVKVAVPDVSAALGPGYGSACENTLGEMESEVLFEVTLPASEDKITRARTAAAGWGGDRWRSFEKPGGEGTVVVWKTVWDTPVDADEFEQAIRSACAARVSQGGAPPTSLGEGIKLWVPADPAAPTFLIAHLGKEVALVAGASTSQARTLLKSLYPSLAPAEAGAPPAPASARTGAPPKTAPAKTEAPASPRR